MATGEVLRAGVCLHRGVFALPRSAAWRVCSGRAGRALCRLCAEPRPDREPSLRRTTNATRGAGGAGSWPQAHVCCLLSFRCCSWERNTAKPPTSRTSSATPMKTLCAVREGRKREFGMRATADELPDPSAPATFESAKLDRGLTRGGVHQTTHAFYAELLRMRGELSAMGWQDRRRVSVAEPSRTIIIEYGSEEIGATLVLCFSSNDTEEVAFDGVAGQVLLDSSAAEWGGPGQAPSAAFGSTLTVRGRSVVLLGRGFN